MSGFARSRLENREAFAREVREAIGATLTPTQDRYELDVVGTIVWGLPSTPTDTSAAGGVRRALSGGEPRCG